MAESKTLYRGEDAAIVEAGSAAEASFKAIGFKEQSEPDPEPDAPVWSDEQPKRKPGRPRIK